MTEATRDGSTVDGLALQEIERPDEFWVAPSVDDGRHGPTPRERLKNRRACETFVVEASELRYTCTVGRFDDGRLAEVFLSNHKADSAADVNARDLSVCFSIAVQHGADPNVIRQALCRDARGNASGPLGVALDQIMKGKDG